MTRQQALSLLEEIEAAQPSLFGWLVFDPLVAHPEASYGVALRHVSDEERESPKGILLIPGCVFYQRDVANYGQSLPDVLASGLTPHA